MSAIHWFRKGLRLHDNPALLEACKAGHVYPGAWWAILSFSFCVLFLLPNARCSS